MILTLALALQEDMQQVVAEQRDTDVLAWLQCEDALLLQLGDMFTPSNSARCADADAPAVPAPCSVQQCSKEQQSMYLPYSQQSMSYIMEDSSTNRTTCASGNSGRAFSASVSTARGVWRQQQMHLSLQSRAPTPLITNGTYPEALMFWCSHLAYQISTRKQHKNSNCNHRQCLQKY
jgi:hypothetical protein